MAAVIASRKFQKELAMKTMILVVVVLMGLMAGSVKALTLEEWDKLSPEKKAEFTKMLVRGTRDILESGDRDSMTKYRTLFGETATTDGEKEFLSEVDQRRSAKPNPSEIEGAFLVTLKNHGIMVRLTQLQEISAKFRK